MINPLTIESLAEVIQFTLWCLLVMSVNYALFQSLPAKMLRNWILPVDTTKEKQASRLRWELGNGTKFTSEIAKGNPHAAAVKLTLDEISAKKAELAQLTKKTVTQQIMLYFLGCSYCQSFWIALIIGFVSRDTNPGLAYSVGIALVYAIVCALLSSFLLKDVVKHERQLKESACPGCGK